MSDNRISLHSCAVGPGLAVLLLLAGCHHSDSPADSGPADSGPPDSGLPDSGLPDSGPPDSGPPDSGPSDSGTSGNGVLPELTNVVARVHGTSVSIDFDPVDGARDYRVYLKPGPGDLIGSGPAIRNAIYRCSGDREAPSVPTDDEPQVASGAVQTYVNHAVKGFNRQTADAVLGYVYAEAGADRAPIYVLGDPGQDGDNLCYMQRWAATRVKKYVTTGAERETLLAAGWRDDGIAFYVPAASASTQPILTTVVDGAPLFFAAGSAEAAARQGASPTAAFPVLTAAADGAQQLYRVHYQNICGRAHDELVRGAAAFGKAVHQGNVPVTSLFWPGLAGATTLVVEALDKGCPFQGFMSTHAFAAQNTDGVDHQRWYTLAELQAASSTGEVFINGQHEAGNVPAAIALSYVDVSPAAPEQFDFSDAFDDGVSPGPLTQLTPPQTFHSEQFDSANYNLTIYAISLPLVSWGPLLGELSLTYADSAGDTNGKFRMTPKQKATLSASAFIHSTMEVDMVSSARRYPQMLISDQDAPVQDTMTNGVTVVIHPIGNWAQDAPQMNIQLCDHRVWDVNNQCPKFSLHPDAFSGLPLPPHLEVGELFGNDRRVRWDVYASTSRVYLLLEGKPFGCANLPAGKWQPGPATVTYADVLYHSLVDVQDPPYTFHAAHEQVETRRHFGQIGFSSGVPAPSWNETILPCQSTLQ